MTDESDSTPRARADPAAAAALQTRDVDVVALFLDAVDALRPPTPAVVIEHPERCVVEADGAMMDALLRALVANAIRFSMDRAEIRVVLGVRPGCSFYVRDNGIGFTRARAARLFAAREPGQETGLATVSRIVALHGGRVWAEAEPGWGATFFIALPPA